MLKLPSPIYVALAAILLIAFISIGGVYLTFIFAGKPAPEEVRQWFFPSLTALLTYFLASKGKDDSGSS